MKLEVNMKILIVTPSYKPAYIYGGPIFSVSYLAEQLSIHNEVLVVTTTANGIDELNVVTNKTCNIDGVNVLYFKRQTKDHTHFSYDLLKFLWQDANKFEIVHIQSWWNLVAIFSLIICKIKNINCVISPRGMLSDYSLKKSFFRRFFLHFVGINILSHAKIHATSNYEFQAIKSIYYKFNIFNIPNFINLPNVKKVNHSSLKNNSLKILFLSRIHPKKGLDVLFNALSQLEFEFCLDIVGDGDDTYINKLKKYAISCNIADKIIWHGSKYNTDKDKMYLDSDIFVLPSHDENFANTVLESLSVGTAVLLSKSVGLSNFVSEYSLGWIYDNTIVDLKNKLNEIYHSKIKLDAISVAAPEIVKNKFNSEKILIDYMELYTLKND